MATILVVEDEAELNTIVCDYLGHRGYTTVGVMDGATALRKVFESTPDLVLLDLNLPGLDGLDVARTIRSQSGIPVIVTTARSDEEDRLAGFETGIDDYVVKPFSLPELAMRVAAVLRRTGNAGSHEGRRDGTIVAGDLIVDGERRVVVVGDREVHPTAAQFAVIQTLARSPGRVYTRLQLLESFQADAYEGYERTIDVHIKNLRKLIETNPRKPTRIVTVWGVGYRLESNP